jgi:hypothetical protein
MSGWPGSAKMPFTLRPDQLRATAVACLRCKGMGKWVEHGPHVGQGWYCPTCKDDIPHQDNVFGISGIAIQKAVAAAKAQVASPARGYGAMPPATVTGGTAKGVKHQPHFAGPHAVHNSVGYIRLECVRPACTLCHGKTTFTPVVVMKGDWVMCLNTMISYTSGKSLTSLQAGWAYQVEEVLSQTIRVRVSRPGHTTTAIKEYSRCRFAKL